MSIKFNLILILFTIGLLNGINCSNAFELTITVKTIQPNVVYVDDDFNPSTPGWGYDHFDNIQDAVDNVSDYGIVNIYYGTYNVFKVQHRSDIIIKSVDSIMSIIMGNQIAIDELVNPPTAVKCVIFMNNSINIELNRLNIQGNGLDGRSYAVFYNNSSGKINNCVISPNQKGNMNSLGIRAQCNSTLSIENSTIQNYGRVGIYCRTGTNLNVYKNKIIGQVYTTSDGDFVSYGIEVEDLQSASNATIRYNDIYNHNYIGNPSWSSAGIIIDIWRYYEVTSDKCSAIIEYNNIYYNMIGLQIIPNENIHVNLNKIYNNTDFGAVSDPYWDGTKYIYENLDAINNWWGDATGPYHPSTNPNGTGNEITDYVNYYPWIENYLPTIKIVNPQPGFLYLNILDWFEIKFPFIVTLIIGKSNIETTVTAGLYEIEKVEFYIDENKKFTDYNEPYLWTWNELIPFFTYIIKVIVYDVNGFQTTDTIKVWKCQYIMSEEI